MTPTTVARSTLVRKALGADAAESVTVRPGADASTLYLNVDPQAMPFVTGWRQRILETARRDGVPITKVEVAFTAGNRMITKLGDKR